MNPYVLRPTPYASAAQLFGQPALIHFSMSVTCCLTRAVCWYVDAMLIPSPSGLLELEPVMLRVVPVTLWPLAILTSELS